MIDNFKDTVNAKKIVNQEEEETHIPGAGHRLG